MTKKKGDRALGMDAEISRRDFLDGVAVAIGSTMIPTLASGATVDAQTASTSQTMSALQGASSNYPPMMTGMRGQTDDAKDAGHALRDGKALSAPVDTGEFYDLVVVGAGMAGLGAAYFYRKQIPGAKVLVIEACPDFGGHAVRNEFMVDGKHLIAGGGTYALWRPNTFPPEAQELLRDVGIDREHYEQQVADTPDPVDELGLRSAMFFDKESFGKDQLIMDPPPELRLRGRGEGGTTSGQLAE
jgi:spermidine dehydrogenase